MVSGHQSSVSTQADCRSCRVWLQWGRALSYTALPWRQAAPWVIPDTAGVKTGRCGFVVVRSGPILQFCWSINGVKDFCCHEALCCYVEWL